MFMPSIFGENLFDDFFDLPLINDFDKAEDRMNRKLYGHHSQNLMRVDVKDKDDAYEMLIDLPGFSKDEISARLDNGYLTISAAKGIDNDEQDKDTGRYIRRERFAGACQRSFYVGDSVRQDDIKAEFKHGILKLDIPKQPRFENHPDNYIAIEG